MEPGVLAWYAQAGLAAAVDAKPHVALALLLAGRGEHGLLAQPTRHRPRQSAPPRGRVLEVADCSSGEGEGAAPRGGRTLVAARGERRQLQDEHIVRVAVVIHRRVSPALARVHLLGAAARGHGSMVAAPSVMFGLLYSRY